MIIDTRTKQAKDFADHKHEWINITTVKDRVEALEEITEIIKFLINDCEIYICGKCGEQTIEYYKG
jgi:hypothetical protein